MEFKMKKVIILLWSLIVFTGFATAQETYAKDGMLNNPGSSNANVGVGINYFGVLFVGGGYETIIDKFEIVEIPISYGVAGRTSIGLMSPIYVTGAAMGTLHLCWGAIPALKDQYWANNVDTYWGIGVRASYYYSTPFVFFETTGGINYFLSETMAINLETGINVSKIGVLFKF